mgnify:CR=1 FL=1
MRSHSVDLPDSTGPNAFAHHAAGFGNCPLLELAWMLHFGMLTRHFPKVAYSEASLCLSYSGLSVVAAMVYLGLCFVVVVAAAAVEMVVVCFVELNSNQWVEIGCYRSVQSRDSTHSRQ